MLATDIIREMKNQIRILWAIIIILSLMVLSTYYECNTVPEPVNNEMQVFVGESLEFTVPGKIEMCNQGTDRKKRAKG